MLRANEDIRRDVLEQLQWDNRIKAADLDIAVADGRVRLRGKCARQSLGREDAHVRT